MIVRRRKNGRLVRVRGRPRKGGARRFGNRVRVPVQQASPALPVPVVSSPAPAAPIVNPFLRQTVVSEPPPPPPPAPVVFSTAAPFIEEEPVVVEVEQPIISEPQFVSSTPEPAVFIVRDPEPVDEVTRVFTPTPVAAPAVPVVRPAVPVVVRRPVPVVEAQEPAETRRPIFSVPNTIASSPRRKGKSNRNPRQRDNIAILRSSYNAPGTLGYERAFDYSFEAENGIVQEAAGELRTVGDSDVMVMRGSYQYTGADGELYQVTWYADETGYHAEANHLPREVPIPYPEIQRAVDAQLRFAAEEDANGGSGGFVNDVSNQDVFVIAS